MVYSTSKPTTRVGRPTINHLKTNLNTAMAIEDDISRLAPLLQRSPADPYPVVLMLCGMSGSGKSTLAKAVVSTFTSFERLSIDNILHEKHGLYGIGFPAMKYDEYQKEADEEFKHRLKTRLEHRDRDIVLDRSFYAREDRLEFGEFVRQKGGKVVLVYFKPKDKIVLWQRICERKTKTKTADSAFEGTKEILETWWDGFEAPQGEGEIIIDVV